MIAPYNPPPETGMAPPRVHVHPMPAQVKARVLADPLHALDPEASTLFDRPPRRPVRCQGRHCGGRVAEPFDHVKFMFKLEAYCWLCCMVRASEAEGLRVVE